MFTKILIANRGEIACRIIRTCRKLGIQTVAVYSDADANAQHVLQADQAFHIGGSLPNDSYLCGEKIIAVAKVSGAQAIHPGYGFLSENAGFADAVETAGITFIGPKAASMRKMGSKAGAKELMQSHQVPVVPGYTGENQDAQYLLNEAIQIGFPLMIKAAHGGGGKGMRIVRSHDEFLSNLESCQREAKNAFGRDRVLLEKYIEQPRHIEIQIFGDTHGNIIHLNERECSAQRRYQKVIEESPSPFLTPALRQKMGDAAVQAGKAIDYVNAGTVEFIVGADGAFYFMEINTRLQVEHPVTELVTGLDLVEWQLRVAYGQPLPASQNNIAQIGHAIEVRLYAEDPEKNFLPGSGKLVRLQLPINTQHVRVDAGVIEGDTVSIFYDPMIAKLIVWDEDRPRALARLRDALSQCDMLGPKSNIEFLEKLIRHDVVVNGSIDTSYLDKHLDQVLPDASVTSHIHLAAACAAVLIADEKHSVQSAKSTPDPHSPWAISDGWRLGHASYRHVNFIWKEQRIEMIAHGANGDYQIEIADKAIKIESASLVAEVLHFACGQQSYRFSCSIDQQRIWLHDGQQRLVLERAALFRAANENTSKHDYRILAPMPGRIVLMSLKPGDIVSAGQEVGVMEAMKMELSLKAPRDGTLAEIRYQAGDFVEADAVLVVLESI